MAAGPIEASWQARLDALAVKGLSRKLNLPPDGAADFCSNDFLSLARRPIKADELPAYLTSGASGSRLISGHYAQLDELETWAACFFGTEAALFFASGYQANLAVAATLPTRHDTLLLDERIHASLRDGSRLSQATVHHFRHNNLADLQRWLSKAQGQAYVITEAVFSMQATHAPLRAMAGLCRRYNACLVVDEAHSLGLHGPQGRGMAAQLGLSPAQIPAKIFPLGKAAGMQGALVCGSRVLIDLLISSARSFIYTTGPAPLLPWLALRQLKALAVADAARAELAILGASFGDQDSILPIAPAEASSWPALLADLAQAHCWVKHIRYPTVPKGEECLRIIFHAHNTKEEIETLQSILARYGCAKLSFESI